MNIGKLLIVLLIALVVFNMYKIKALKDIAIKQ